MALGGVLFTIYNKSMKKYVLTVLITLLGLNGAWAHTLNVLILKRAPRAELSFMQNYAVVIGKTFYGPISKNTRLLIDPVGSSLRLTLQDATSSRKKSLGTTKEPVHIVRSLGTVSLSRPSAWGSLKKRALPAGAISLEQDAKRAGDFVAVRQVKYGGLINYSGPLSAYAKGGVNLVETVELEHYVTHVVNCELGSEKSLNALKAQSVLARTFGLFSTQYRLEALDKGNTNWQHFQLFSDPTDQAYNCRKRANGKELPSPLVKQAVRQTAGEVLVQDKALANIQYNTCSRSGVKPGVICQEKIVQLARSGRSYRNILRTFLPKSQISRFNPSVFYTQTVRNLLKKSLHK